MINYKVIRDDVNKYFKIEGDFIPGSKAVKIPADTDKSKNLHHQYISFFLSKSDIDAGIDYLNCISLNNHPRANEGLFIGALSRYYKCFQHSNARVALDKVAFKRFSPQCATEFERFENWRNKHYIHDENGMIQACAFLLVAPNDYPSKFGGPPSVVWNSVSVDYIYESKNLQSLMQETLRYIEKRIDKISSMILEELDSFSHDELLALDDAHIELATVSHPEQKRGENYGSHEI